VTTNNDISHHGVSFLSPVFNSVSSAGTCGFRHKNREKFVGWVPLYREGKICNLWISVLIGF